MTRTRPRAVVSGTSSDSHMWNLVYLQLLLEESGFDVLNVGACVPDPVLAAACARHRPDLVVVSSVNGHGWTDGARVVRLLRGRPELEGVTIVIGGKLGVAGDGAAAHATMLRSAGFDAVYEGPDAVEEFRQLLARIGCGPVPAGGQLC